MREIYDFRLFESEAARYLGEGIGIRIGALTRQVVTTAGADEFTLIGNVQRRLLADGRRLIASWNVRRKYTPSELAVAQILRLQVTRTFEPAGEECGTVYDETNACPYCGCNRSQVSPLRLRTGHLPTSDLADTIARETVASGRLIRIARDVAATGLELAALEHCDSSREYAGDFQQVHVVGPRAELVAPTAWGHTPFDDEGSIPCPNGHVGGLNVLSEAHVSAASWPGLDVVLTRQHEGRTSGLLRPNPLVIISASAYRSLRQFKLTGWIAEVAHLV